MGNTSPDTALNDAKFDGLAGRLIVDIGYRRDDEAPGVVLATTAPLTDRSVPT